MGYILRIKRNLEFYVSRFVVVGGIVVVIPIHFCVCSSTFVDIDENHGSHQGGEGREI